MLDVRPIVVDENWTVLGGNMRLRALQELKVAKVPVTQVTDWTEDQKKEFIIKDNVAFGEWDWDVLANEWDISLLHEWGMHLPFTDDDIEEMRNPENADTEHPFANELDRESNYIVLKFATDIDWIQAKTLFGLQTETAQRSNGKPWSSGIGRVLDGPKAIAKIAHDR